MVCMLGLSSGLEKRDKHEFRKAAAPKQNDIRQTQNKLGLRLLSLL